MDKSRLLKNIKEYPFYAFGLAVAIGLSVWWIFWYTPLRAHTQALKNSIQEMERQTAKESIIEKRLVDERCELVHLELKCREFLIGPRFSEHTLSKDILSLVHAAKLNYLYFRLKPWQIKKQKKQCAFETAVRGSYEDCFTFLKALYDCGAVFTSCSFKKSGDANVELSIVTTINVDLDARETSFSYNPQSFTLRNIFKTVDQPKKSVLLKESKKVEQSNRQPAYVSHYIQPIKVSKSLRSAAIKPKTTGKTTPAYVVI